MADYKHHYVKGHFIFGQGFEFKKDPIGFFENMAKENKGIQSFRFGYLPMINITAPDLVKHVLQTNNKNYHKGIEYRQLMPLLGLGLLTNEGESWLSQRRLAQPAFHKKRIAGFQKVMEDTIDEWISKLMDQQKTDIHDFMMRLTMDIVSKTLFSTNVKGKEDIVEDALADAMEMSYARIKRLANWPLWVPSPDNIKFKKAIDDLNGVVNGIIDERRASGARNDDLLDMLMYAEDEETGAMMNNTQLRDEVMTLFLAGHETTANALTWWVYLMSKHPEIRTRLQEELKNDAWNYANPYLKACLEETMRLYPPVWIVGRRAIGDDQIGPTKVKKGDNILICTKQIHISDEYWDEPLLFNPDRFLGDKSYDKFQYFPFGGGPRFCIGNNFAMLEMQITAVKILQNISVDIEEHIDVDPLITLRPKGRVMAKLTRL